MAFDSFKDVDEFFLMAIYIYIYIEIDRKKKSNCTRYIKKDVERHPQKQKAPPENNEDLQTS